MKFPGRNQITLSMDAVHTLISDELGRQFGGHTIRVTSCREHLGDLRIDFTTDPDPDAEPIIESMPVLHSPRRPIGDTDDHPF